MNKEKPLISVIVPVYNGQDYLENCIKSIQNQTYGRLEILIINDGSTDATEAVCDKLRKQYDNVRILTSDDRGVSVARNMGIEGAEGELIAFVDADDRLHPEMLERLYACMTETGSDVAGCRFFQWGNEAEWEKGLAMTETGSLVRLQDAGISGTTDVRNGCQCSSYHIYEPDVYLRDAVLRGNSRCWSKLYRKQTVGQIRFREGLSIGEDMLFLLGLLPLVKRIVELDFPGYGYYQNPEGAIQRKFTPSYMDQITCWQLAREEIQCMDRRLDAQVCVHYVMGILLTAGKLAMLPAAERRGYREYVRVCRESLQEAFRTAGVYGRLPVGYRVKAVVFLVWPEIYLKLYHLHKKEGK